MRDIQRNRENNKILKRFERYKKYHPNIKKMIDDNTFFTQEDLDYIKSIEIV